MHRRALGVILVGVGFCLHAPAEAKVSFVFDYSMDARGFFDTNTGNNPNGPAARAALERAGRNLSDRLIDNLTEAGDKAGTDGGDWTGKVTHPATGVSNTAVAVNVVPANAIYIYAGGRAIGGGTLGIGGPGGFSAAGYQTPGSQAWLENLYTRGQPGASPSANPRTDFAPWGGAITFDDTYINWFFGLADQGRQPTQYDFLSVATHELAHVLGIGTSASWNARVNGSNQFVGPRAAALHGGNVPLSADGKHWASSVTSTAMNGTPNQPTAMAPDLGLNQRKMLTMLDWAGLGDVGWEIARPGDADADGSVGFSDLLLVAQNYEKTGTAIGWSDGDFDSDGAVGFSDLLAVAQGYGTTGPLPADPVPGASADFTADWSAALAMVPEPSGAGVLALCGLGMLGRRKRRG